MPGTLRARTTLFVLTAINLLNYLDRYVVPGSPPLIKAEFGKTDAELGVLTTSFLLVYSVISPFTGLLGDRFPRKWFVGGGVLLWSGATVWSGLAQSFSELLIARACLGIGEAGYAAVAPSLISDVYERSKRGMMLSIFYAAMPVGSALGYGVGSYIGTHHGWREAFFVAALPGFVLGVIALLMPEPRRGASDPFRAALGRHFSVRETLKTLVSTRSYVLNTLGSTAMVFAMGGLGAWMPTFLNRERGIPLDVAGLTFSGVLIVAGFGGTLVGGWLGDRIQLRHGGGYFISAGGGLLIGVPASIVSALATSPSLYWPAIFVALFFLFFNTGPINAALLNVVPAEVRSSAMSVYVLVIHLLGDAISPPLIGAISDASSLENAILLNTVMIALAGLILVLGAGTLARDMAATAPPTIEPTLTT